MFKSRLHQKEFIDNSELQGPDLHKNLKELSFINRYWGPKNCLLNALEKIFQKMKMYAPDENTKIIKIIDLGCGAGDLLVAISHWAKPKNIQVDLLGLDANPHILAYAKENTKDYPNIRYLQMDIHSESLLDLHCDVIYLNDVLHHFTEKEVIRLLENLKKISNKAIILSDLTRSRILYYLVIAFTHLLNFCYLAKNDGPLSVLRAFKKSEMLSIFKAVKITNFELKTSFIYRWQAIIWCGEKAQC